MTWIRNAIDWWPIPRWMPLNTVLALLPLGLCWYLFRDAHRARTKGWWATLGLTALFLPNAPYVLTDATHLARLISITNSVQIRWIVMYGAFFTVGVLSYAACIALLDRYLAANEWSARRRLGLEMIVHLACAYGVLLGRFQRTNSWWVVTHPFRLSASLFAFMTPRGVAACFVGAGIFFVGTTVVRATVSGLRGKRLLAG
jgi:uncharacterized membrane protein